MKHYLVVTNRTLGGRRLREEIHERAQAATSHFHVLVPANWPQSPLDPSMDAGEANPDSVRVAEHELEVELDRLRELDVSASGEVAGPDPLVAVQQAMEERRIDEILLSTPPAGPSSWLGLDLPSKIERAANVPVTTILEDDT